METFDKQVEAIIKNSDDPEKVALAQQCKLLLESTMYCLRGSMAVMSFMLNKDLISHDEANEVVEACERDMLRHYRELHGTALYKYLVEKGKGLSGLYECRSCLSPPPASGYSEPST